MQASSHGYMRLSSSAGLHLQPPLLSRIKSAEMTLLYHNSSGMEPSIGSHELEGECSSHEHVCVKISKSWD
jgi:hypothetical protein